MKQNYVPSMKGNLNTFSSKTVRLCAMVLTSCLLLLSNVSRASTPPVFTGGDTVFLSPVCSSAGSVNLSSYLLANDPDAGETLTFRYISGYGGTVSGLPATAGAGTSVGPTGVMFNLTTCSSCTTRYAIFQVSDGVTALRDTIVVMMNVVYPPSVAPITGMYDEVHVGETIALSSTTTGGTWASTPGITIVDGTGVVTGFGVGYDTITYTVTNACHTTERRYPVRVLSNVVPTDLAGASSPVIRSIDSATRMPGQTLDIPGGNFNATTTENVVFFGATRATVNTATTTNLNVTVPWGATFDKITVMNNETHLYGASRTRFQPTFDTNAFIPSTLFNLKPYDDLILPAGYATGAAGNKPYSVEMKDLDGDGKADLIVGGTGSSSIYVYKNISSAGTVNRSSFALTPQIFTVGAAPINIKTADLNFDGKPEIIVACASTAHVYILTNQSTAGAINFASFFYMDGGILPSEIVTGDFNNDGRIDIAVAAVGLDGRRIDPLSPSAVSIPGQVTIIRNHFNIGNSLAPVLGSSSFDTMIVKMYDTTNQPLSISAADFNSDGKLDLVVSDHRGRSIEIFRNTTSSPTTWSFAAPINISTAIGTDGGYPNSVRAVDLDRDGYAEIMVALTEDIVVATTDLNHLLVKRNIAADSGSINFSAAGDYLLNMGDHTNLRTGPTAFGIGDLDGDKMPDIVVTNGGAGTVSIIKNTSSGGTLGLAIQSTVSVNAASGGTAAASTGLNSAPIGVVVADVDNNTVSDILVANRGANTVALLWNFPIPDTTSIIGSADSICLATTATLSSIHRAGSTGYWSSSNTSVAIITAGTPEYTATLQPISAGTVTITYAVVKHNDTNYVTHTYVIADTAHAGTITGSNAVCLSSTTTLTETATTGTWSTTDASIASVDATGVVYGVALGSADINYTVTVPICGSRSQTHAINVSTGIDPGTLSGPTSLCLGSAAASYSSTVVVGTWSAVRGSIDGTGSYTVPGTVGTDTIMYTTHNACGDITANYPITIGRNTAGASITGLDSVCRTNTITLANAEPGGTWSTTDASIASVNTTGVVTGVAGGNTTINYSFTGTCAGSNSKTVYVNTIPTITVTGSSSVTLAGTVTYTETGAPAGGAWTSSNTSIASVSTSGAVYGVAAGTANISYTFTNNCGTGRGVRTINVIASAYPPAFVYGDTVSIDVCFSAGSVSLDSVLSVIDSDAGQTLTFTRISPAPATGTVSPTTGTITSIVDTQFASGFTYSLGSTSIPVRYIRFTVGDGTYTDQIVVRVNVLFPISTAPITGSYNEVYVGAPITLNNITAGGTWSATNTNATISSTGVVTGVTPGVDTIVYSKSNGCYSADSTWIVTVLNSNPPTFSDTTTTVTAADTSSRVPDVTLTLTGANFNSTASENIVYFGATKASVTSAATDGSSITVTVPRGAVYGRISVLNNQTHLTGFGRAAFMPYFDTSAFIAPTLTNIQHYDSILLNGGFGAGPTGIKPYSMEHYDLDGDGKPEMIVCGTGANYVYVYKNISSPGEASHRSYAAIPDSFEVVASPINLKVADFNGDGKGDIVVAGAGAGHLSVLRNISSSTVVNFAPRFDVIGGIVPSEIAVGDYDKDGRTDIAVVSVGYSTSSLPGAVIVLRNNYQPGLVSAPALGTASFDSTILYVYGVDSCKPLSIAAGDLDNDGKLDLVVTDHGTRNFSIFKNNSTPGNISFASRMIYSTAAIEGGVEVGYPNQVRIADLNMDGSAELIVAVSDSDLLTTNVYNHLSVRTNTAAPGSIDYSTETLLNTGVAPDALAVGDLNGDRMPDLVVSNAGSGDVTVLLNSSSVGSAITMAPPTSHLINVMGLSGTLGTRTGINAGPISIALSDVDGNGVQDITVVSREANQISILRNYPIPDTTSMSNATTPGQDSICLSATATLSSGHRSWIHTSYWTSSDTTIARVTNGTPDYTATLQPVSAGTVTITYYVVKYNDTNRVTHTFTIADTAHYGNIDGSSAVCLNDTIHLSNTTGATGGVWSSASTSVATVDATGIVYGAATGSAVISYTVTVPICPALAATKTITVNPLPNAGVITGPATVCTLATENYSSTVTGGNWSNARGAGFATVNPTTGDYTAGTTTGADTVLYVVTSGLGCGTATAALPIAVTNPTGAPITGTSSLCSGTTVTLSNAIPGGTWSSTATGTATVSTTGVVYGVAAGTATISYVVTGACGFTSTFAITVDNAPDAGAITGVSTLCVSDSALMTNTSTTGVWSVSNTTVATISAGGMLHGAASGVDTVIYTATTACGTARVTHLVTVNPGVNAGTLTGAHVLCGDSTTTWSSSGDAGGAWSTSDATTASVDATGLIIAGSIATADTALITYTVTGGCLARSVSDTIRINPAANAGTLSATSDTICISSTSTMSSAGSVGTGIWSSSDITVATVSTAGVVTGLTAGSATISYLVSNSCGSDTASRAIVVRSSVNAGTISGSDSVCVGTTATLTSTVAGGTWSVSSATIASVSTATATTGTLYGVSTGTETVVYTVPSAFGCTSGTASILVHVNDSSVSGNITGPTFLCSSNVPSGGTASSYPSVVSLTATVAGGTWSVSPSTAASIDATGTLYGTAATSGTVTVSYGVPSIHGCPIRYATRIDTVGVAPATINITGTTAICVGVTTTGSGILNSNVLSSSFLANTYTWSHATSAISATGVSTNRYQITGVADLTPTNQLLADDTVTISITNTCGSNVKSANIFVYPQPIAGQILGGNRICNADSIRLIDTSFNVPGGGAYSDWTSLTPSIVAITGTHPGLTTDSADVRAVGTGVAVIQYRAVSPYGCGTAYAYDTITVNRLPNAGTITGADSICANTATTMTSSSITGVNWYSSDVTRATVLSSASTSTTVTGGATGGYNVIIYVVDTTTYCGSDSDAHLLYIKPAIPSPGVIVGQDTACAGLPFTLWDTTGQVMGVWSSASTGVTITSLGDSARINAATGGSSIVIKYTTTNECGNADTTLTVKINSIPAFTGSLTGKACDSTLLVYAATADSSAAVLTWTRAGVTGLANVADTGVGTPGEYLDDTTNVNVIATYVYTAELHGCISAPVNVNITVVPTPYLLSKHFDTVCSQSPYLYVPVVSTGAATKQRWSRAVATGISNAAASDTVGTISETLASTDLFRHTATYIYTMFTDPACPVTDSLKVAVDPRPGYPQIATHSPSVLCAGTMYQNFGTANEPPAGVNYAWTASNAIVWAQGLKHQYSLINFTNPGLATVYINATLPGFTCASKDSFTVNVGTSVSNKPEVIWFNGDFICLSNTEDSYQWGYDDVLTLDSTLLPYETNQNYTLATPDTAAKYYWVITTHEDCMQKSYFKAPTKVREVSAYLGDVTVYPNPASNYVNVELKNGVMGGKYTVDVVNMLGQKVAADKMMDNKATFDVSDYAAGVYFVDCYKDGVKFATVKFVRN